MVYELTEYTSIQLLSVMIPLCQLTDLFLMEMEAKHDRQECRHWNQTNG